MGLCHPKQKQPDINPDVIEPTKKGIKKKIQAEIELPAGIQAAKESYQERIGDKVKDQPGDEEDIKPARNLAELEEKESDEEFELAASLEDIPAEDNEDDIHHLTDVRKSQVSKLMPLTEKEKEKLLLDQGDKESDHEEAAPSSLQEDATTKAALTRSYHEDELFAPASEVLAAAAAFKKTSGIQIRPQQEQQAPIANEDIKLKMPEALEDYVFEHTEYYEKSKALWNQCVNEATKKKPISHPDFKDVKKHQFIDKNIEEDQVYINYEEGWVFKGSMLKGDLHGPGSKMMEGGQIMYESIFIKNEMQDGYMITFDENKNISQVMKCKKGIPATIDKSWSKLKDKILSSQLQNEPKGSAGTGEHAIAHEDQPEDSLVRQQQHRVLEVQTKVKDQKKITLI